MNTLCAVLPLVVLASSGVAGAQDAQLLMRTYDQRHRLPTEKLKATLSLQSEQGDSRSLSFEMLTTRSDKEGDRLRLRFAAPAEIAGTTLLNVRVPGKEDEQWLYLPSFRKTRRVGGNELGDRFVGSDLFYEDLKQRPVDDFAYKLLRTEKVKEADCYVLEGAPSSTEVAKASPYGKKQVWLRKDILFPVRVRVFDRDQKPTKEIEYLDLKNVTGQVWQADKTSVVDVQRRHRTLVTVQSRQLKLDVGPDTFSQHTLGRD